MYGREYQNRTYTLEASGGLANSALVMQDRETDSYWSIMTGEVIAGSLKGLKMQELPVSKKYLWQEWKNLYPDSKVLSINGREDAGFGYQRYFDSAAGFRGAEAVDKRLKTKEPVFAFRLMGIAYAVPHGSIENGVVFDLGDRQVFLFRPSNASIFASTSAFVSSHDSFIGDENGWRISDTAAQFNAGLGDWSNQPPTAKVLVGFDTFWYNWSLSNPETRVLEKH